MKVDFSKYTAVQIERDGPVLRVSYDRPDQLNAVSREVHGELETLFFDIDRDEETRLAVLSGRGRPHHPERTAEYGDPAGRWGEILPIHRAALERMRDRK